jgi:uncharacterized protein
MTHPQVRRWAQHEDSHRIGRVASVQSEKLVIELDPSTTGLVKAGISGVVPVGTINSYVTCPAGPHRLVAVITSIEIARDGKRDSEAAVLDISRRLVGAVMVGRIDGGRFVSGITTYPSLFAPVSSATPREMACIFAAPPGPAFTLGEAVVSPDQDVLLDANKFLSRHSAVLGSTGAGKTCSVVAAIDGLLALDIPAANIVIFDANSEYAAAFGRGTERGRKSNACVIGPEPGEAGGLFMPHWFMDNEDHIALLRASEGVQAPLLQRAIADARLGADLDRGLLAQLRNLTRTVQDIRDLTMSKARKPQEVIRGLLASLSSSVAAWRVESESSGDVDASELWNELAQVAATWEGLNLLVGQAAWDVPVDLAQREALDDLLGAIEVRIREEFDKLSLGSADTVSDFDAPRYYSLEALNDVFLPDRIERESAMEPKVRAYAASMMMRLSRLLADSRYNFMTRVDSFDDPLARYLRYLLGQDPMHGCTEDSRPPWQPAYQRRSMSGGQHTVTIIDLSMIASDVLENVTAMLGRMLLGFAQRIEPRASLPMLLVLEEAHRYIPAQKTEQASRSSAAFERIAKEGRKFGVSLMLASQRPSELSRTVLSQCGTLIAHRVVNPDDQELIRHATPFASREILKQLSGLATQHAIVLGEATQVPAYVRVRDILDAPRGSDPDFIESWKETSEDRRNLIDVTAHAWEQSSPSA